MRDDSRKLDYIEQVKVPVGELAIGMFVSALDRPWEETPFLFQGFEIKEESDIDAIAQHCRYVYIDSQRTRVLRPSYGTPGGSGSYFRHPPAPRTTAFAKELEVAVTARAKTSSLIKSFMDDIKFGRSIDVQLARSAVSECVASVTRNPEAMMFLAQIRHKDEYTSEHSFDVCVYAIVLGRQIGMQPNELENLGTSGLLHDMGKVSIPPEVLLKKGQLTDEEFALMKKHTLFGRDILMSSRNLFSGAVDVAYAHHENMDGSGYPRGLQGHQLSQNTRIVAVADRYDAITSERVYQKGRTHMEAITLLNKAASKQHLDNSLTVGFVSALGVFPAGSIVELTSGEIAIVLSQNPQHRLRPQILVVRDSRQLPVTNRYVDLAEVETDADGTPYKIKAMHHAGSFGIHLTDFQQEITKAFG